VNPLTAAGLLCCLLIVTVAIGGIRADAEELEDDDDAGA